VDTLIFQQAKETFNTRVAILSYILPS